MQVREVAERFGVDVSTVRGWIKRKLLPAQWFGGVWLVDKADVERFTPPPPGRPPK
jgi:excisionase family DNA binding protein